MSFRYWMRLYQLEPGGLHLMNEDREWDCPRSEGME